MLLELPKDARNAVSITETGEDADNWIIAMPLADDSLEDVLAANGGKLSYPVALVCAGVVAHEIISGRRPFDGTHAEIRGCTLVH